MPERMSETDFEYLHMKGRELGWPSSLLADELYNERSRYESMKDTVEELTNGEAQ